MQLHDLADESSQLYMVMPVMSGGNVESLIGQAKEHRLPLEQALAVAKDVCQGLGFAHSCGVVRRDLKPCNV